jgi:hypothetical protein
MMTVKRTTPRKSAMITSICILHILFEVLVESAAVIVKVEGSNASDSDHWALGPGKPSTLALTNEDIEAGR